MSGRLLPCLGLCLAFAGCITTPLQNREWLALSTAHYDIWSSLGEHDTARLAIEIERFRAAAEFIWGRAIPAAPVRTRIYAFDDRGVARLFAFRSQRSYLLPRQRGDVIVLRTGEGWEGDARTPLKLEYARRLFWNASPDPLPPWFEEGLPQLASTLEIRGEGATVGALRQDHVHTLREGQWIPFDRLLAASDLIHWSSRERTLFEAEAWALCHYLVFSEERRAGAPRALAEFRALLDRGIPAAEAARTALGENLQQAVWTHVSARELDSFSVRIRAGGTLPVARAVSQQEILEELGWLSLAIGEPDQARRYLESALALNADSARALAGLGDALADTGDRSSADARYRDAQALDPEDPLLHLGWANALRVRAAEAGDPAERARLASQARDHYQRSLDRVGDLPEAHAGMAATYLLDGEDAASGTAHLRAALALLPGDTAIRIIGARLALAVGHRGEARSEATQLLTRARSEPDLEAARSLLERIDSRAAIP